jgi:signal peptidase I
MERGLCGGRSLAEFGFFMKSILVVELSCLAVCYQIVTIVYQAPATISFIIMKNTTQLSEQEVSETISVAEQVLADKTVDKKPKSDAISTILLFAGAIFTAVLLNVFVFQSYEVDGHSMEPTLQHQDRMIIYKLDKSIANIRHKTYLPNRGDIIVFHKPNGSSDQLIKRVIGLPGERVVVKNEKITVYNAQHPEGFNPDDAPYGDILPPTSGNADVTVLPGEVFVSGDNRIPGASLDSRSSLGDVPSKMIVGKLVLRYLPFGNFKPF